MKKCVATYMRIGVGSKLADTEVARIMAAPKPPNRIASRPRPIFVLIVQGRFPRLRQNRASLFTVSGKTTLRCRASVSSSHSR
jgi:hypothetical protein